MKNKFEIIFLTLMYFVITISQFLIMGGLAMKLLKEFVVVDLVFLVFLTLLSVLYGLFTYALISSLLRKVGK